MEVMTAWSPPPTPTPASSASVWSLFLNNLTISRRDLSSPLFKCGRISTAQIGVVHQMPPIALVLPLVDHTSVIVCTPVFVIVELSSAHAPGLAASGHDGSGKDRLPHGQKRALPPSRLPRSPRFSMCRNPSGARQW